MRAVAQGPGAAVARHAARVRAACVGWVVWGVAITPGLSARFGYALATAVIFSLQRVM